MPRDFDAKNLVPLPRLTAVSMAALLTELLTAADAEKRLPRTLAADRDALRTSHVALNQSLKLRLAPVRAEPSPVRDADAAEDRGWAALLTWLQGWSRLPGGAPEAAEAQSLIDAIFPDGLKFTQLKPKYEWQEAETRLSLIADRKYDVAIKKLGGARFLEALAAVHRAYGEALGITVVRPAVEAEPAAVREALVAATDALRTYVLGVTAHARKGEKAAVARAARLLAPLSAWETAATAGARGAMSAEPPPDTEAATPA